MPDCATTASSAEAATRMRETWVWTTAGEASRRSSIHRIRWRFAKRQRDDIGYESQTANPEPVEQRLNAFGRHRARKQKPLCLDRPKPRQPRDLLFGLGAFHD